jgi:hypothetical protein
VGRLVGDIIFPANWTFSNYGNNAAAILLPDGHSINNTQPLYRCVAGGPVMSQVPWNPRSAFDDIVYGNGTWGAHGGSSLSSIGGTIRLGELLPDTPPPQHALKLQLYASTYYYSQRPGFVWPALNCDGYAFDPSSPLHYGGSNPYLSPGSLLAVPAAVAGSLNVTTLPGRKILYALSQFGGYLVDDTAANRGTIGTEAGVTAEFATAYGYAFDAVAGSGAFFDDLLAIFSALQIVVNNGPGNVGGGGTPMQPPPPPFC